MVSDNDYLSIGSRFSTALERHDGLIEQRDFNSIIDYANWDTQFKISLEAIVKLFNVDVYNGLTAYFQDGLHLGYVDIERSGGLLMRYMDDECPHSGFFHLHRIKFLGYKNGLGLSDKYYQQ